MADFLLRALLAGAGIGLVAGPLGCFIVWRRMAYFGDSLAHNALLGVVLGIILGLDASLGILIGAVALAWLLVALQQQRHFATDTLLGLMSHSGLALGLVALSFFPALRLDLMAYLFGDILAVSAGDLAWILGGGAVVLALTALIWQPLLALTVHEDLARAEGVPVLWLRLAFVTLIAVTIAIGMKIVGILLITAMLIVPAAAARRLARTPEQMAALAALFGVLAALGGLMASFRWDTPSGPSVVVAALGLFLLALPLGALRERWSGRQQSAQGAGHSH
jgi:zinc transport system permease protein